MPRPKTIALAAISLFACAGSGRKAETAPLSAPLNVEMVQVPAGEFWYGCNEKVDTECDNNEKPGEKISLPAFSIDRTEVTVAAYAACVKVRECEQPATGGFCNWGVSGREDHPVNCVNWNQADSFCKWAGKRLPTEQEWEKAARGTDGRKYPWGNGSLSASDRKANIAGSEDGFDQTAPVGSFPSGASPYGALDMIGNVWEWTAGWYEEGKTRPPQAAGEGIPRR